MNRVFNSLLTLLLLLPSVTLTADFTLTSCLNVIVTVTPADTQGRIKDVCGPEPRLVGGPLYSGVDFFCLSELSSSIAFNHVLNLMCVVIVNTKRDNIIL